MEAEAELLSRAIPGGAFVVTMDERGKVLSSPEFAAQLARWRDDGRQDVAFVIGGADGIAPGLRERAAKVGGWLDVSSSPRGTSVILSVPLPRPAEVPVPKEVHDQGDFV